MKTILHGEAQLNKISHLPEGATKIKAELPYHIIAKSESSGNHHVIDTHEGVDFYEKDGVLYLKNDSTTQVRCVVKERHDSVTLEPGIWEIGFQKEYDYLTEETRRVSD